MNYGGSLRSTDAPCATIIFAMTDPKPDKERNFIASAARYSEIGFIIPAAVILGFILGKLGDYWFHTTWLYLAGLIFGAVVGFVEMIRMAMASTKDKQ
jgi:F0F1-type ATP synthase assembly protein I